VETIKHYSQIWEVQGFLSKEELLYFNELPSKVVELDWFSVGGPEHWRGRDLVLEKTLELDNLEKKVASLFKNYERIHDIQSLLRYRSGDMLGEHRDNSEESDYNNIYGLIIYLNDDYEGGEIYYPDVNIKIKPKAGSIVIHDAGILHGVKPVVGTKIRYVLTSFVKGDKTTCFLGE